MANLVQQGDADLVDQFIPRVTHGAQVLSEDQDPVRHGNGSPLGALFGERHAHVNAEQVVRFLVLLEQGRTGPRLNLDQHVGKTCSGIQIHTDNASYCHNRFRPYRLAALILKAVRLEYPDYVLWRDFPFEYEADRLAFDLLSGGPFLRGWVDDPAAMPSDLDVHLQADERAWRQLRDAFVLY